MDTIVIALGGNAIKEPENEGTAEEQAWAVERSCEQVVEIIKEGFRVVLTHGNGPQVGNLLIQQETGIGKVPPMPLDICGAMTQGQIGYLIQQKLGEKLRAQGLNLPICTAVTQVLVDEHDPAFANPTKPIGPFYSGERAEELSRGGLVIKKVSDGKRPYRRVVPSPDPKEIIEEASIKALIEAGHIVIACGGGGIPVIRQDGRLQGIGAVIDKDLASALLARAIGAEIFLNLTDVEHVALNYGRPDQVNLDQLSLKEAKRYLAEGHFPPGSMGPKILSAIRFLENGGKRVIITSLEKAKGALFGKTGTEILKNEAPWPKGHSFKGHDVPGCNPGLCLGSSSP